MTIRPEQVSDIEAITDVIRIAFADCPYGTHNEHAIVSALRAADALTISLVAEMDGCIAGHIAFSPVGISDGSPAWYGLGPVGVLSAFQRQGIGKALIREGLSLLSTAGARGCVLVGYPAYYERFGFRNLPGLAVEGVPSEYVLALPFVSLTPTGTVSFHEAFDVAGA